MLATPTYVLPARLGWLDDLDSVYLIARLAAALLTALTVCLLLTLFLTCTTPLKALFLTGAMAFGTSLWTTASQGLWQHTSSVLLLSSALLLFVAGEQRQRLIPYAGFLLLPRQ